MLDETQEVVTETPVIETPTTKTTSELTDDVKSKVIASLTEEDYLKFINLWKELSNSVPSINIPL